MASEDRLKSWSEMWSEGKHYWHSDSVNRFMEQFYEVLAPDFEKKLTFFLPLCGKAGDLKWLYDKGHSVIGVEGVCQVVEEFFTHNQINYEKTPLINLPPGSFVFKSSDDDGRISIYCCDFFQIEKLEWFQEASVDAIWDRGALVAVNPSDRVAYSQIMTKLMVANPNARYLVMSVEYDQSLFGGPPCSVPNSEVFDLFENTCEICELLKVDDSEASKVKWNVDKLDRSIILLTLKKSKKPI